jgi:hypothetical protein
MSQQRHIIGRALLELNTGNLADVWSLQEEVSRLFQQQAVPEMERLFDRLVEPNQVIRLDQVVVEVGAVDRRYLQDELLPNLLMALQQALNDTLQETIVQIQFANQVVDQSDATVPDPVRRDRRWDEGASSLTRDRAGADWEVWLYFLQYGRLPWWVIPGNWQDWFSRWETVMQQNTQWRLPLLALLATHPVVRQRLIEQTPAPFRHQLIAQIQPAWIHWPALLEEARQFMQRLGLSSPMMQQLERQAWQLLLAELTPETPPLHPLPAAIWIQNWLLQLMQLGQEEIARGLLEQSREIEPQSSAIASQRLLLVSQRLRTVLATLPVANLDLWQAALEQVLTLLAVHSPPAETMPGRETDSQPMDQQETASQPRDRSTLSSEEEIAGLQDMASQHRDRSTLSPAEETAGLYVTQAGLVLLHPFLRFYLEAVGLVEGESFRDEPAQQTAIYLMYYLATRQTDAPEYELVLPKLLCGWPLDQPVVRGVELPEAALSEGESLLQTVINYWEVLKSTSPDGLREGFLQRAGKLTQTDDGNWKLQVEQQAIDILLGRLPWGLSMVTLPWMEGLLMVEWT